MRCLAADAVGDDHHGDRIDNWELVVDALLAEAAELEQADRRELAARMIKLGGYESADGTSNENARARLALRIAARLSAAD